MPYPKFSGIDFSKHDVIEFNPDQPDVGKGFRCGRGEFVSYIKGEKIRNELRSSTSKCWLLSCRDGLAAYVTLLADKLTMGTPILIDEDVRYTTFPAVKVGWLAADPRAKGSGSRLMNGRRKSSERRFQNYVFRSDAAHSANNEITQA